MDVDNSSVNGGPFHMSTFQSQPGPFSTMNFPMGSSTDNGAIVTDDDNIMNSSVVAPSTFASAIHPAVSPTNNNNGPQPASFLGMVASGYPMRMDFCPTDPSGTKFTLSLNSIADLPTPLTQVHELAFFLLPNATLPPNTGLMIYWQLELPHGGPASGFELLGTLDPSTRPSEMFRTGWAEHDQFVSLPPNQIARINIGVSVEPIESVRNVEEQHNLSGKQQQVAATTAVIAQKIGQELFNYMRSFDTNGATGNQTIAVPANIFDRWWQRFERKLQRDPNFFLKNGNNE
ncbi:DUF775 domain containing protein [Nitzschia inconspicua]|uniref:DUF775 domain containing protein n=1 Tax=Nitzschia inconspicua TaxID=303405 RepID=A0A9K3LQQ1_9STRA|nr:DUF775 domain containing protein [Nitzschia inconspicua]